MIEVFIGMNYTQHWLRMAGDRLADEATPLLMAARLMTVTHHNSDPLAVGNYLYE